MLLDRWRADALGAAAQALGSRVGDCFDLGWYGRRHLARANRARQAHQVVPPALDRLDRHPAHGDALERFWHRPAPEHKQLSLAQIAQPRAQVEAQELCDRHRHVRDPVGVHGQQRDLDAIFGAVVLLDAFGE